MLLLHIGKYFASRIYGILSEIMMLNDREYNGPWAVFIYKL